MPKLDLQRLAILASVRGSTINNFIRFFPGTNPEDLRTPWSPIELADVDVMMPRNPTDADWSQDEKLAFLYLMGWDASKTPANFEVPFENMLKKLCDTNLPEEKKDAVRKLVPFGNRPQGYANTTLGTYYANFKKKTDLNCPPNDCLKDVCVPSEPLTPLVPSVPIQSPPVPPMTPAVPIVATVPPVPAVPSVPSVPSVQTTPTVKMEQAIAAIEQTPTTATQTEELPLPIPATPTPTPVKTPPIDIVNPVTQEVEVEKPLKPFGAKEEFSKRLEMMSLKGRLEEAQKEIEKLEKKKTHYEIMEEQWMGNNEELEKELNQIKKEKLELERIITEKDTKIQEIQKEKQKTASVQIQSLQDELIQIRKQLSKAKEVIEKEVNQAKTVADLAVQIETKMKNMVKSSKK
jgi:hypothetical protein